VSSRKSFFLDQGKDTPKAVEKALIFRLFLSEGPFRERGYIVSAPMARLRGVILTPSPMLFADVFNAILLLNHPKNILRNFDNL